MDKFDLKVLQLLQRFKGQSLLLREVVARSGSGRSD